MNAEKHILVVDDEECIRLFVQEALALEGIECSAACCADEALSLLGTREFDLLVTDIKMPGMDGISLMRAARGIHPGLPTLVITGYATGTAAREHVEDEVQGYLLKPFTLNDFLDAVSTALAVPHEA
jgi:DNA-binding NtrC family response regulator